MRRNIVIKKEFTPISIQADNRSCYVMWDYQPTLEDDGNGNMVEAEHGTCYMEHLPMRGLCIDMIKNQIDFAYNRDIKKKIVEGFKWNGKSIYLSTENQFNYKSLYDIAYQSDGSNLPVKLKVGNGVNQEYVVFNSVVELQMFHLAWNKWINDCIQEGWELKDSVDYSAFEEALKAIPNELIDPKGLINSK